jgi:Co/Zn/Cd efflux system component
MGMETKLSEISQRLFAIEGVLGYSQPHVWELKTDHLVGTVKIQVSPNTDEQVVRVRAQQVFKDVAGCKEVVCQIEKDLHSI